MMHYNGVCLYKLPAATTMYIQYIHNIVHSRQTQYMLEPIARRRKYVRIYVNNRYMLRNTFSWTIIINVLCSLFKFTNTTAATIRIQVVCSIRSLFPSWIGPKLIMNKMNVTHISTIYSHSHIYTSRDKTKSFEIVCRLWQFCTYFLVRSVWSVGGMKTTLKLIVAMNE